MYAEIKRDFHIPLSAGRISIHVITSPRIKEDSRSGKGEVQLTSGCYLGLLQTLCKSLPAERKMIRTDASNANKPEEMYLLNLAGKVYQVS